MTAEKVGVSGDIAICQSFESHFLTHGLVPCFRTKSSRTGQKMSSIVNVFSPMHAVYWGIEDPKGKPMEKVREIRDEIEEKIRALLDAPV